jgi:hypothetical protein
MWHDQPADQNMWNFALTLVFAALVVMSIAILDVLGRLPLHISLFDFFLLALGTFRLTRLFVYDAVVQFVRDPFFDLEREGNMVRRVKPAHGIRRTMADLFLCPWCIAMWAAGGLTFFYYLLMPYAWYPILILGVAGAATLLQLISNWVGWSAEELKQEVQNNNREHHEHHQEHHHEHHV